MPEDFYNSAEEKSRAEFKEKKSKFIATVIPIENKEQAKEELDKIKKEFYDASHNCYAWRLGNEGLEYRSSDDGEPNGSAGKPILFALKKYELSDVLLVVTRFFGGTKLGVGGLARAYGGAAELVLEDTKKKQVDIFKRVSVFCTYEEINVIKRLLSQYALSYDETYTDSIVILAKIPQSKMDKFCERIVSKTNARAGFRLLD
jgi:uncharacterized YigZ family protein